LRFRLGNHQEPEQEGNDRDDALAFGRAHRSRHGALVAPGVITRDRRRTMLPAYSGTFTT
jgi:hypothetical protein